MSNNIGKSQTHILNLALFYAVYIIVKKEA